MNLYEEKYKEALERAKKLHDSYNLMHISVDEIEQIFPELAESEDERIRMAIIEHFKQSEQIYPGLTFGGYYYADVRAWLEKQKEQKQEWSESDKQNINLIISYLDSYIEEHNDTFGADECKSLKYWLKSLRPQPQVHSEDDKKDDKPIDCDLSDFDDDFQGLNSEAICRSYKGDCMNCPHNRIKNKNKSLQSNSEWRHYIWATNLRFDFTALIKYDNTDKYEIVQAGNRPEQEKNGVYILIKDIKPQPHWKPSEKQMKLLLNIEGKLRADGKLVKATQLAELYEQIKKLM